MTSVLIEDWSVADAETLKRVALPNGGRPVCLYGRVPGSTDKIWTGPLAETFDDAVSSVGRTVSTQNSETYILGTLNAQYQRSYTNSLAEAQQGVIEAAVPDATQS